MIRPGRSDTWTGPLVVIAVANLTAVVLCAWPVGPETLRKLVNFEISRPADDTSDTPDPSELESWDHSEMWLDGLSNHDRKEALAALRSFRTWLNDKPAAFQSRLMKLPLKERQELIDRTRQRERDGPLSGLIHSSVSSEPWIDDCREFLSIKLMPRLSELEMADLERAALADRKGWLVCLARLAHDHLYLPQGKSSVLTLADLPADWNSCIHAMDVETQKRLQTLEGRWPDYAIAVYQAASARPPIPSSPLGPCQFEELPMVWQGAMTTRFPVFQVDLEKRRLNGVNGRWPDYPRMVLEQLRRRGSSLGPIRLPGPIQVWKSAFESQ